MQTDNSIPARTGPKADSIDLVTQTRSLRRKVIFWRRTAWLLLGGLGIIAIILWQRGERHQRTCKLSLEHYYREAANLDLQAQPIGLMEAEWRTMKVPREMLSPYHYNLIALNWRTTPPAGEKLPLAVCRESHALIFDHGRHVLFSGGFVEWCSDDSLAEIVRAAESDDERTSL